METQGTAAVIKVRVVVIITPEYYFVAVVCCDCRGVLRYGVCISMKFLRDFYVNKLLASIIQKRIGFRLAVLRLLFLFATGNISGSPLQGNVQDTW